MSRIGATDRARAPPGGARARGRARVGATDPPPGGRPAEAAAQRRAADAGVADEAPGAREAMLLGRRVALGPGRAAAADRPPRLGVDRDRAHPAQVDHQPVVADPEAGEVVAAAANGDVELVVPAEVHG